MGEQEILKWDGPIKSIALGIVKKKSLKSFRMHTFCQHREKQNEFSPIFFWGGLNSIIVFKNMWKTIIFMWEYKICLALLFFSYPHF